MTRGGGGRGVGFSEVESKVGLEMWWGCGHKNFGWQASHYLL